MTVRNWTTVALAAPGCLMATGFAVALALAAFGRHPMWVSYDLNLSEASAVRDEAEVARLIEYAEDPNLRRDIRPGLLFERRVRLTPLEAAVAAGDGRVVRELLDRGAVIDAETWNRLRCAADGDEVPPTLDASRPSGAVMHCAGITPPW